MLPNEILVDWNHLRQVVDGEELECLCLDDLVLRNALHENGERSAVRVLTGSPPVHVERPQTADAESQLSLSDSGAGLLFVGERIFEVAAGKMPQSGVFLNPSLVDSKEDLEFAIVNPRNDEFCCRKRHDRVSGTHTFLGRPAEPLLSYLQKEVDEEVVFADGERRIFDRRCVGEAWTS